MLPASSPIPSELRHARFVAVPLTEDVAGLDYRAYMSSPDVIRLHSDGRWPVEGFSFETNLEQVQQHWSDHEARRAFTFTLLTPSREEGLGCLYLNPLREFLARAGASSEMLHDVPVASAMVTFWLRQDQQAGLAEVVVDAVDEWLRRDWPLDWHLFRVLPTERSSCAALESSALDEVSLVLPGEARSYRWFQPAVELSQQR